MQGGEAGGHSRGGAMVVCGIVQCAAVPGAAVGGSLWAHHICVEGEPQRAARLVADVAPFWLLRVQNGGGKATTHELAANI